ncbi:MAG: HupE/UreJ family protein [Paracoccaceae bacterium]
MLIGFDHIVPKGLDHILFVLGLFFFSLKLRPLLYQVSAFTVAHTVTLALAILGLVRVPAAIVEPLIAASIAWIAVENILFREMKPWRTAVVFGFGLLHGLGFASVLSDIGLNPARFVTGLIGFNVGVELGQIAVLAMAWGMLGIWFGKKPWWRARVAVPASLVIAATGAYWFVERLAA